MRQWGGAACVTAILATTAVGAMVVAHEGIHTAQLLGGTQAYYVTPWCRAPAYLLGLLLGMAMHERRRGGGMAVMGQQAQAEAQPPPPCVAAAAARRMPAWAAATGQVRYLDFQATLTQSSPWVRVRVRVRV